MFLTGKDNGRIMEEIRRTIEKMQTGSMPDTESEYFRGLESICISDLSNRKRAMRDITISLIISEQEQGEEICTDWIENVYCKITEDSVTQAYEIALWDAQSVLNDTTVAFPALKSQPQIARRVDAIVQ